MMISRRHVLGLLAASALPVRISRAQSIDWPMVTEYPATSMSGEGLRLFAEAVARESGDRITLRPSFDAGLKSADAPAAVRDGRVAAADAFAGGLGRLDPLFLLSSLPFLAATNDDARRLYAAARTAYTKRLAQEGQILLFATPWPPSGLWAKKPIVTSADLAGLAIRTYDATGAKVFTAAGAAPANLSFADTMPKLADGSIAAVLSSGDGGAGRRLWDHLRHFTEINYAVPLSLATLNTGQYTALPADLRAAVDRAAAATETRQWQLLETRLADNYARMAANGVTITKADAIAPDLRALLARSASDAIDAWKAQVGPEHAGLLATVGK
ncbi:MAG TPA: TRAP transporter substrate-binding protein [Vineibacter sp.]|nr:TRAP transporter substrate-binding protein [Vineibacter sp.]